MVMRDFSTGIDALALNTASLGHNLDGYGAGWTPEQVVDACAARGIGGIVFWRRELQGRAHAIGNYCRDAGITVAGLCRSPFLTGSEAGDDAEMFAAIDETAELGAGLLTIVTGGTEPGSKGVIESQKRLAERLNGFGLYAARRGIRLALEPLNPMFGGNRTCIMTIADALRVCEIAAADNIGVAVDVYHVWWDAELEASLARAGSRIFGYHLCDWLENTGDMLLDRGMMGDGVADLKSIRGWVEAAGYDGFCEVEIFSAANWWQKPPEMVLDTIVERFKTVC